MLCPGQDLNLHGLPATTPSKWRVYQFHHPDIFVAAKVAKIQTSCNIFHKKNIFMAIICISMVYKSITVTIRIESVFLPVKNRMIFQQYAHFL